MKTTGAFWHAIGEGRAGRRRRLSAPRLWRDRKAAAIVEFGLIVPVFFAVLAASIDLGQAVRTKFQLASALAAASNYALNSASSATSSGGVGLASNLAKIAASYNGSSATNNANVVVNNGPTASVTTGGAVSTGGTASNADLYYCPSGSGASTVWGSGSNSSSSCASGGVSSGKFVLITVSRAYTSLILPSPMVASSLTASSMVQVK